MVRLNSQARREEILDALMTCLAARPIDDWSVRGLAATLNVSTWMLLKLFRTRKAILLAALARVRGELGAIVSEVVCVKGSVTVRLRALVDLLVEYYGTRRPGVGRLFFLAAVLDEPEARRTAAQLMSMQTSLVAVLLREAQAHEGLVLLDAVTPDAASRALVAYVLGSVLQDMTMGDGAITAAEVWSIWMSGVVAEDNETHPVGDAGKVGTGLETLCVLDVRPILASGRDPLTSILAHLERVPPDGVLEIAAPFRPSPLITLLAKRGFYVALREASPELFLVDAVVAGQPEIVDLSDRPAPEPMAEILRALSTLGPSDVYLARVPKRPNLLLPKLASAGMNCAMLESADGTVLLRVCRREAGPS